MSLAERFYAKVDTSAGPDACHPWTGATNEDGYGVMRPDGQRTGPTVRAHRVALILAGHDLTGLNALHSCDNPPCCNVRHLRPGTQAENLAEMRARGRGNIGSVNGAAKLTEEAVQEIRLLHDAGVSQKALCAAFGVTKGPMSALVNRKTWQHVA